MTHGWRVLVGWGLLLVAIALVEIVFGPSPTELALLGGSGGATVLVGLLTLGAERAGAPPGREGDEARGVPDLSPPAAFSAIGAALFVTGWALGPWLVGIGGGVLLIGLAGVVRELRAQRRSPG